ncbi:amidohydrolase family protein [Sphingomonas aerophila]|uniref:Putative TIM-barrel fold metal-dependent hydrolase n=1 Tax=Sphingomonas aerophila TaxID=1344948 RepID=A0A7W9EVR8_9SPHN|nr:amidohydrolase family protein [Sphingomonas aerophila]MBB5716629.1 putative TIM-barrel fold metal-dependent hydrolase [Sphingomonas aerophila]
MPNRSAWLALVSACALTVGAAPAPSPATYSEQDFDRLPKFDAHFHANRYDPGALATARRDRFELLSINVDYPDFPPLPEQAAIAERMRGDDSIHFQFTTAFSMDGFGTPGWSERTIRTIDAAVAKGAVAVKVWKNIGMIASDSAGKRVFLDDPRFDPVMKHLEERGIPLIAHQGEPKNCWLPLDQMTTDNDREYFREHPEYYMYLHPNEPSYEQLMSARDRFVARHPRLAFDGAHMASLEWSVDELARFFDRYPNAVVDLAARLSNLQVQSNADLPKVRAFFIKYQDRIMYGTDLTDSPPDPHARAQNPPATDDFPGQEDRVWRADWRYLATPLSQHVDAINADAKGLGLPREVINKIYWANAHRFFRLTPPSKV